MKREQITQAMLRDMFSYDPVTGVLRWRNVSKPQLIGKQAGYLHPSGYRMVKFGGMFHKTARLVWKWMTGRWPHPIVDHKNTIRSDDRWENLREATHSENCANKRSRLKFKGVYKARNKWRASIFVAGKKIDLGTFSAPEEAHEAYTAKAKELRGEFARAV